MGGVKFCSLMTDFYVSLEVEASLIALLSAKALRMEALGVIFKKAYDNIKLEKDYK